MARTREIRDRLKALATGRLEGRSGRAYWRSLEELAAEPAFHDQLLDEFPSLEPMLGSRSRRDVLRIMGASLGLAGLAGCDFGPPQEKALPYVRAPEFEVPGDPKYYATAVLLGGYALPVLAETHVGRPVKVEGNPEHPVSRGATDLFAQASVLDLYDPDRSGTTTRLGQISTFDAFQTDLIGRARELEARRGSGLALLTGAVTSPTTLRLIERARERLPELRWFVHEPVGNVRRHEAARRAFGRILDLHPRLDRAGVTLCLEADPLGPGPAQVPNARAWVDQRRARIAHGELPKLYVLESTPSLTGAKASEALPAGPAEIHNATLALAQHLGIGGIEAPELPLHLRAKVLKIALELERSGDAALVLPGAHLDPELQALVFRINQRLGGLNRSLVTTEPVEARPEMAEHALPALAAAIPGRRGRHAPDPRLQPGLHRSRRSRLRRAAPDGAVPGPRRAVPGRDGGALSVARAAGAPVRDLERRTRRGRHGERDPAAGAPCPGRTLDARGAGDPLRAAPGRALRDGAGDLAPGAARP